MDLINIGIIFTYIMVFGAALAVVVFSVMQMMKSPKNAKKTLYTVGGLMVVSYLIASSEVLPSYEKYHINSGAAKRVGMGLNAFYFLVIGAVLTILYTEFGKAFKK